MPRMKKIEVELETYHYPYLFYQAKAKARVELTPAQQRVLDGMETGAWYENSGCERHATVRALVSKGRCELARIARKDKAEKIREFTPDEMLVMVIMPELIQMPKIEQPIELYRRLE